MDTMDIEDIMVETTGTLLKAARQNGRTAKMVVGLLFDPSGVAKVLYAASEEEDVIDVLADAEDLRDDGEWLGMPTVQVDVSVVESQWKREGAEPFVSEDLAEGEEWDDEDWDDEGEE